MEIGNGLKFGIQAVAAGQKSATVNAEPKLIANSTTGKFTITSPVSKALDVAVGENVMFLNNIPAVEAAIAAHNEQLVAYAKEHDIDIETREGQEKLLNAFRTWYVAKGVGMYDSKGNEIRASLRYTKDEKQAYINDHADEILEAYRAKLVELVGDENATDEELIAAIPLDMVKSPTYHVHSGSKTAATSNASGVGAQLNFTDTAIWTAIKDDLGEDEINKKNRTFKVNLNEAVETQFNNGKEVVTITAYPLEFEADTDPIRIGANK